MATFSISTPNQMNASRAESLAVLAGAATPAISRKRIWAGRILTAWPALLLAFSAVMKLAHAQAAVEGLGHFGYAPALLTPLGILELFVTVVYLVPRTSVLGAILVAAYLGGATATNVRVGDVAFVMPVLVAVMAWAGLCLRNPRVWSAINSSR